MASTIERALRARNAIEGRFADLHAVALVLAAGVELLAAVPGRDAGGRVRVNPAVHVAFQFGRVADGRTPAGIGDYRRAGGGRVRSVRRWNIGAPLKIGRRVPVLHATVIFGELVRGRNRTVQAEQFAPLRRRKCGH